MSNRNKEIMRFVIEEVWNNGNMAVVDDVIASDWIGHTPPDTTHGPEEYARFFTTLRTAFPDIHFTIEDQVAEGDMVVSRWTARATHQGQFHGIPPTGRQAEISGVSMGRIVSGKAVEGWTNLDMLGLMRQIGAVPAS